MGEHLEISRSQTVKLIRQLVKERVPTAAVRFGEGEGRLLTAKSEDDASMKDAIRKLHKETGLAFSPQATFDVQTLVAEALERADISGIRGSRTFSAEHKDWMDRIGDLYDRLPDLGGRRRYVTHCLFHHDLRQALPSLLHDQPQVTVISCRDIGPRLESDYGLKAVIHQVPSQYVMRAVDGEYEKRMHSVPIWPEFYRVLESKLEAQNEGELFLVGAGLFGKALCIRIRELGGIALDMGSVLDQIADKTTRGRYRPEFWPPPPVHKHV